MIEQLKETKTAKGETKCPTLLHYLARVLLRTDPALVQFMDEMPHLEAAARGAQIFLLYFARNLSTPASVFPIHHSGGQFFGRWIK